VFLENAIAPWRGEKLLAHGKKDCIAASRFDSSGINLLLILPTAQYKSALER